MKTRPPEKGAITVRAQSALRLFNTPPLRGGPSEAI